MLRAASQETLKIKNLKVSSDFATLFFWSNKVSKKVYNLDYAFVQENDTVAALDLLLQQFKVTGNITKRTSIDTYF